ncbi:hypothetical protein Tco_0490917 [Tanacetum coccineum]
MASCRAPRNRCCSLLKKVSFDYSKSGYLISLRTWNRGARAVEEMDGSDKTGEEFARDVLTRIFCGMTGRGVGADEESRRYTHYWRDGAELTEELRGMISLMRIVLFQHNICTDKAKNARKRSKPDKHGHEERKSTQEAEDSIAKRQKSNLGQHKVNIVNPQELMEGKLAMDELLRTLLAYP